MLREGSSSRGRRRTSSHRTGGPPSPAPRRRTQLPVRERPARRHDQGGENRDPSAPRARQARRRRLVRKPLSASGFPRPQDLPLCVGRTGHRASCRRSGSVRRIGDRRQAPHHDPRAREEGGWHRQACFRCIPFRHEEPDALFTFQVIRGDAPRTIEKIDSLREVVDQYEAKKLGRNRVVGDAEATT